jgi:transposase
LAPPDDDHDCGWKAYAAAQEQKLAELTEKLAALERRLFEKKSERRPSSKLPPPLPKVKRTAEQARQSRQQNAALRDASVETEVTPVPVDNKACPKCDGSLRHVGSKPSVVWEYVQPFFRKRIYERETVACACGHITTAPAPERMGEKTRYAPSFVAHLIVNKCAHSNPQNRLEKAYRDIGVPMSRSTMCNLIHRAARELRPLHAAALALVPRAPDVHADETSMRQWDHKGRCYLWTFVTPDLIVYRYATTRSGSVPEEVLGDSPGRLVVDQYTGYNAVTKPGRRTRAGCFAHVRRKIYEQRQHPETEDALDLITQLYRIEDEAKAAGITGSESHLALRQRKSKPIFTQLLRWARAHRGHFGPRSALGRAIRYVLKNFRALGCFLRHASIPLDNNIAEASLRRIALGRVNYLFFGNEQSGHDFAALYTLVASCEKHRVNAIVYLTDVLIRVQRHPARDIEELLPHRWKPPD